MLNLSTPTSVLRVITGAASDIEVHVSWMDLTGTTVGGSGFNPASIVTAMTTVVVTSPGAGVLRNVKHLNITNNHAANACPVTVEHFDGTNTAELMAFDLLPGENMIFNEEGRWTHRDAKGAEYPPAGKGAYDGRSVTFMKSGSAPDAANYWYCTSKDGGFPGAWSPGAPGVNGRVTDGTSAADAGCVPIANPTVGANYLTELQLSTSVAHTNQYFDVLWVNTALSPTVIAAQAFTVPTLPPRDINGTTSGEGCMIALLCTSASGLAAAASNATITYTNSKGVAGRVATLSAIAGSQAPATPVIGTLIWFNLQAGDTGVQAGAWSITLSTSWVSGTFSLLVTRGIATIGTVQPSISASRALSDPGVRLWNNSCVLHCILASAPTATFFSGELTVQEK